MKSIKAFTLIELLVVVVIIGVLAAVALPQYNKAVEKARATEAITVLNTLQKGIDIWLLENTIPENGVTFFGSDDHDPSMGGSGFEYNADSASLNVDFTCNEYKLDIEGSSYCSMPDFAYTAVCFPTECSLYAQRVSKALREHGLGSDPEEDFFMVSSSAAEGKYTLVKEKNLSTGKWSTYCNGAICPNLTW